MPPSDPAASPALTDPAPAGAGLPDALGAEVPAELLELLRCPDSQQTLRPAAPALLASVNDRLAAGGLRNRAGQARSTPLTAALVRADGQFLYPVEEGIPILLVDEAFPVAVAGTAPTPVAAP